MTGASERAPQQTLLGVSALLFAASATITIVWAAAWSDVAVASALCWYKCAPHAGQKGVSRSSGKPHVRQEFIISGRGCLSGFYDLRDIERVLGLVLGGKMSR